jgi:hypothetical protein
VKPSIVFQDTIAAKRVCWCCEEAESSDTSPAGTFNDRFLGLPGSRVTICEVIERDLHGYIINRTHLGVLDRLILGTGRSKV